MKKITALILAAALCFGLCACDNTAETLPETRKSTAASTAQTSENPENRSSEEISSEAESTGESTKKIVIPVWTAEEFREETQNACAAFLQSNSAIESVYEFPVFAVAEEELMERLDASLGAGILDVLNPETEKAPGLFFFPSELKEELVRKDYLSSLPNEIAMQKLQVTADRAVKAASDGSDIVAYPIGLTDTQLLFYNKNVLPEPSDFETMLGTLEEAGYDLLFGKEYAFYPELLFRSTGAEYTPKLDADGKITDIFCNFYEEGGVEVLRVLSRLKTSRYFGSDYENIPSHFANTDMPAGAAIASVSSAAELREVLGDAYGAAALPALTEWTKPLCSWGSFLLLGVNGKMREDKQAVCHRLAAALSTINAQQARYETSGLIPVAKELQSPGKLGGDADAAALSEQLNRTLCRGAHSENYESALNSFTEKLAEGALEGENNAVLQQALDELCAYLMADVPKETE